MLKLQIKDAGAWRNLVSFDQVNLRAVLYAAVGLLRSLQQPKTVMRVTAGAVVSFTLAAPDYIWRPIEPEGAGAPVDSCSDDCIICDGSGTWFGKVCVCKAPARPS